MNSADDLRRRLSGETPYILIVLFVLVVGLIHGVAGRRGERGPAAEAEEQVVASGGDEGGRVHPLRPVPLLVEQRLAGRVWRWDVSIGLFGVLGGFCVLVTTAVRKLRGRALLTAVPTCPARWGPWDALKVYCVQLAAFLSLGGLVAACFPSGRPGSVAMTFAHAVAAAAMVAVGVRVAVADRGSAPEALGLTLRTVGRYLRVGFLACLGFVPINLALAIASQGVLHYLRMPAPEQTVVRMFRSTGDPWVLGALAFAAVVVAPVAEEFFYRGMLIPLFRRWMRPGVAIVAAAFLFALAHVNLLVAAPIFALGLLLGYLFDRTQGLVAPIFCHMVFNLFALLAIVATR